jgi:hypothetical protein
MAKNRLWKIDTFTARAHTQDQRTHTRLLNLKGAALANTYFRPDRKLFAWDIDIPFDGIRHAERILGAKCESLVL